MNDKDTHYKINLYRGVHPNTEMTVIEVGLNGQVVSYTYYTRGKKSRFHQYTGMRAEALANQMCEQSDPQWER